MKRRSWACCADRLAVWLGAVLCALLVAAPAAAATATIEPTRLQTLIASDDTPPADPDPRWRGGSAPDSQDEPVVWYRVPFELTQAADGSTWMLYLPYFYGGGRVWLNGAPVASVTENSPQLRVRWERPLLLPLPMTALRDGRNVLHLRVVAAHQPTGVKLPQLAMGPQHELQPSFDRRLFLVRTLPMVTVATGSVAGLFFLFIWWRRRAEVAYGLFGLAALLWALRTTTFVFDAIPNVLWVPWRAMYHAATGGFIALMALFMLSLGDGFRRTPALLLAAYVALGPLLLLIVGEPADRWLGQWWVLGLVPLGLAVAVLALRVAWLQRSAGAVALAAAVALAFVAGLHDYAVAWSAPWIEALLPRWSGHRLFLLHHAANLMLIVMGALLTLRFVRTLGALEAANRTLEARVAAREQELARGYERIAALQREQATNEERQRIMQELHDGLGSQLFSGLMRAERGALDNPGMVATLRSAIDEMRVAIDALTSDGHDFRAAFASFRFRWDARLADAGVAVNWSVGMPDEALTLNAHDTLQLLRIAQEALTNVLKHAQATRVQVRLDRRGTGASQRLSLIVQDDGEGVLAESGEAAAAGAGRGLANMRARATRAGASLVVGVDPTSGRGTRVSVDWPLPAGPAPSLMGSQEAAPLPPMR